MKRILLVGAGHAHSVVLASLRDRPLYGARIALVTPLEKQLYSGMLPGIVAGLYRRHEAEVDVARLAEAAYVELIPGRVADLDAARRVAILEDGGEVPYDVVSLNAGSLIDDSVPGAAAHALAAKPYDRFIRELELAPRIAVAGGGAAGAEIAMALRARGPAVTLYSEDQGLAPELAARVGAAFRRMGVDFRPGMAVTEVEPGPVVIAGTARQEFDLVVWTTGSRALPWLARSGLATDERGFVLVERSLRSVSHPDVFAAGDCATLRDAPHPKSGVYAVRQGRVLAGNLRRLVRQEKLRPYRPQRRALSILNCGTRYAIAQRGGWTAEGWWVWRWKDRIDRRWIRRLRV